MSTAQQLLSIARHGDGGTVPLKGNALPSHGYYVGGHVPSLVMDASDVDSRERHAVTLASVALFLAMADTDYAGVWRDGDKIYIDAVDHVSDWWGAAAIAQSRHELAMWDVARGQEIRFN